MEPRVFLPAVAFVAFVVFVAFVAFVASFTDTAQALFNSLQSSIVETFGWFYILTATLLLVFTLWLTANPNADMRLGGKDSRPGFSYAAWSSMLLSAGIGIGIVFFGARISKRRTIREFLVTALLVPTLGSFVWFAALGATGLDTMIAGGERVANLVRENEALALVAVLDTLPLTQPSRALATLLVIVFFVTSSDSGSFVDDLGPQD